jgi:hypothetical protein
MKNKLYYFLFIGVIITAILHSCISNKRPDQVSSDKKTLNGKAITVQYPNTWYIDTLDEDYNAEKVFSINTDSGQNYTAFFIFAEAINLEDHINAQIETNKELIMKDGVVSEFSNWGKFKGKGALLTGSFFGSYPGKIKVFAYTTSKKGFLIFQQTYNEDEAKNKEGFELIEKTFELK